jgi:hypothetical protein
MFRSFVLDIGSWNPSLDEIGAKYGYKGFPPTCTVPLWMVEENRKKVSSLPRQRPGSPRREWSMHPLSMALLYCIYYLTSFTVHVPIGTSYASIWHDFVHGVKNLLAAFHWMGMMQCIRSRYH